MEATLPQIQDYFAISKPFDQWVDDLPWRSDPHLRVALNQFRGLRILQQNVGETLLCFLLSPLKRIPQIREGFVTICSRFGERLLPSIHTTPSWDRLATLPEALLRACGIGYRAKSIAATARFLAEHPNYLEDINTAPTVEAQQLLEQLPGVGSKIASCVLLFGLGRMEAFPVDTWIQRTLCATYSLEGFTLSQIETFARAHFGQKAGLAQQFLFASIRESARKH